MAAINFPNPGTQTPSNTFSPSSSPSKTLNGLTYVWNGVGWRIKPTSSSPGGASVTISDTSPGDALNGDLWWDSGTPTSLFIYYTDSDSSQWVPATPQTDSWYINGGQIVPSQSNQSVNIGTGALIAGSANIGGGDILLNADGSASFAGTNFQVFSSGSFSAYKATTTATDTLVSVKSDIGGTKNEIFQIAANGSVAIAGNGQDPIV